MIVNIDSKHNVAFSNKLRDELLTWVNTTLKSKFMKVEELCTGAAYCQLIHAIYPQAISIRRVKFVTNLEHECLENFKLLQKAFQKLGISKSVPIVRLCKGKYEDNFEFLTWFRRFYEANASISNYDPIAARNGMPMKYGPVEVRRIYEKRAKEALQGKVSLYHVKSIQSDHVIRSDDKITTPIAVQKCSRNSLNRSATRTLIKYKTNKSRKKPFTGKDSPCEFNMSDGNQSYISRESSIDSLESNHRFRRSGTRTIIKYNKGFEKKLGSSPTSGDIECSYPVVRPRMPGGASYNTKQDNDLNVLQNRLKDLERQVEIKNRESSEKELEIIKLQNDINEMRNELRQARHDRDSYFDKMHRVAVCCRNAQYKAEITVPISEILEIFLDENKKKDE